MNSTHPLFSFCYFVAIIALTMCALQPLIGAVSLASALIYLLVLKGPRPALRMLAMALAVILIVVCFQMLTSHLGNTVLFCIGSSRYTLEALLAGLSMAEMLTAVIIWFSCYQEAVGADRFLSLFSRFLPTTSMMVSMVFNYVPGMMRRARQVSDAYKAIAPSLVDDTAADRGTAINRRSSRGILERLRWPVRLSSVLMGWSMETGLIAAASMRARGYGTQRRTSYLLLSWTFRDGVLSAVVAVLVAAAIVCEVQLMDGFGFYPEIGSFGGFWQYLPGAALMCFPVIYEGGVRLRWRLSKF
ncbi:MAG: energy-coupling factor transporter transmembrane protein EcfT [Actinomycetia bacterium]|nr:energy-coupling factor transporter transmembrane protein EcfT [Actinomycetes bacterium]